MNNPNNEDYIRFLWNSGNILALGMLNRLAFNRKRYLETPPEDYGTIDNLLGNISTCNFQLRTLQNIILQQSEAEDTFLIPTLMLLTRQISDRWYMIHHEWLDVFEAPKISDIKSIDFEMNRWESFQNGFDEDLVTLVDNTEKSLVSLNSLEHSVKE